MAPAIPTRRIISVAGPNAKRHVSPPRAKEGALSPLAEEDVAPDPTYVTIEELCDAMDASLLQSLSSEECARREARIKEEEEERIAREAA